MSITEKSNLVTAPSATKVSNYVLTVNSKVNANDIVIDKKAYELYEKIFKIYTKLNNIFSTIANEYKKCANQSVKGDKLVSSLKKVAKNCEYQGKYCLNRQKDLRKLFKYALTETGVNDLNAAVESGSLSSSSAEALNATSASAGEQVIAKAQTSKTLDFANKQAESRDKNVTSTSSKTSGKSLNYANKQAESRDRNVTSSSKSQNLTSQGYPSSTSGYSSSSSSSKSQNLTSQGYPSSTSGYSSSSSSYRSSSSSTSGYTRSSTVVKPSSSYSSTRYTGGTRLPR